MRILFSFENLLPSAEADAEVFLNTAAAIARRGHDSTLLVPQHPEHPPLVSESVLAHYETDGPLQLGTLPANTLHIGAQHLSHAWRITKTPEFRDADLIYTRNLAVVMSSLQRGQRVFFDHYRPWGDQLPILQPLIRSLMGHPNFLGMVCHSHFAMQSYIRLGVPPERLRVSHNGFSPARLEPQLTREQARAKLELPQDRPIVAYTGRVNAKKGLDVVLEMAAASPRTVFLLVGSKERGAIEIAAEDMENVRVFPWQSFSETAPFLHAADVLIIPPSRTALAHGNTVLPLKVYLYLGAGRPILAGDTPDVAGVLEQGYNAELIEPGNVGAAIERLNAITTDAALAERLSANALESASKLTWDTRAERNTAFIEELREMPATGLRPGWRTSRWLRECGAWLSTGLRTGQWMSGSNLQAQPDAITASS